MLRTLLLALLAAGLLAACDYKTSPGTTVQRGGYDFPTLVVETLALSGNSTETEYAFRIKMPDGTTRETSATPDYQDAERRRNILINSWLAATEATPGPSTTIAGPTQTPAAVPSAAEPFGGAAGGD
ncbi:hypothetical protein [Roseovarius aestuariivivens]|uniref:hypothetical protein n=1 Tax=Roseovarius aestuariivivens TaxID=1888910 RepID=UPI001080D789|nr:hypothetical protein [Roseovarius aestuariivivens]